MPKEEKQTMTGDQLISLLLTLKEDLLLVIEKKDATSDELHVQIFGKDSEFTKLASSIRFVKKEDKQRVGIVLNEVKEFLERHINELSAHETGMENDTWIDVTAPGIRPPEGHLHIVTEAIEEITQTFKKLGFTRVRHPEVDWDWYAFEALNMPKNHPARDEWETFFITYPGAPDPKETKYTKIVLTPHTSNGQVREMEKGILPIRMINIAKCYRRQIDVSHAPMFHQFEGLYIDKEVSIGHLKGVMDYFAANFFGKDRKTRIRPFHFQFTEPSFEIDISCGICHGKARLPDGQGCKLCKEGWLELGGAGMVHPNVLRAGGIDPDQYNGFAFGWGVERTAMMKAGTQLNDVRTPYENDVRFLQQF